MLERIFAELGPWNWMVLGFILLALEIAVPGVFLLWIGIAALVVGAASLALWDAGFWTWQVQVIAFLALSLVSAYIGKQIVGRREGESDQPLLNRRGEQMIGQRYELVEPIVNGRGKARVGDGQWLVSGPDLPQGSTVEVIAVDGTTLRVREAA